MSQEGAMGQNKVIAHDKVALQRITYRKDFADTLLRGNGCGCPASPSLLSSFIFFFLSSERLCVLIIYTRFPV